MTAALTLIKKSTRGSTVHRLRVFLHLSQQELADLAGVPLEQVGFFEHNLPLPLDSKRRILKELWARKSKK